MKTALFITNACRFIARFISIFVLILGIPFLLFVGLQLGSGESGSPAIYLYLLLVLAMLAGFVIVWWKEGLGSAIILVSLVGSIILSGDILPGVGARQGFSLLVGPLNLLFAIFVPGYHPDVSPLAKRIPLLSWIIPITAVTLFFVSWWIRRRYPQLAALKNSLESEQNRKREEK